MKVLYLFLVLICGSAEARAGLVQQTIEYTQGGAVLEGYLVFDDSIKEKRPGVLVVHEWMGLNDYAKARADQLAQMGYTAFAADIYGKGIRPSTPQTAGEEAGKYKSDRPLLRARAMAGLEQLKNEPHTDTSRLAAIGYCFGGTTVLELARFGADVKAVVSFHGGLGQGGAADAPIKAKILVLHGADDPFVPPSEVEAFEQEMKKEKADYRLVKYSGAVHGFTNSNNKGEIPGALYNAEADAQSWEEMKEFFQQHLK